MFAGQQVGRKIDVLAAPARAVNPAVPSYEEHFARHPEDVVKGLAIGASIVVPAGAAARGGALIAGGLASREAARHTATHVIRTGGGGAGYVTPAKTAIENVIKLAGPGATLIGATQWGRPETRTAGGMPTGMPDWMDEWSDPHGGAGYGPAPEIEMPDPADRGERYPGEDFGDYLRYRDELARREGPVRREGPTPYYRGPEIIGGGRTVRSPEMQPGEGILRGPEIIGGGRTVHSPEIDGILEPWQSRPERLQPRDGPTLPTDITAGSAITRTPPRTHRAPSREIVDDSGPRYIFGHDRPTLAPAREMPDLDTWATTLSKDAARDLEIQFGSALSPPGPAAVPRYTLEARLRSRDRSDSLPEWDASPLSLPGTRTEAGARTRTGTGARSGTATGTRTGTRTGVRSGIGTGTIPDIANRLEFPPEYPDRTVEMPPGFETVLRPPRTGDRRRRDRRRDEDEKRKKKSRRRSNASYDWIVENPAQDIESMFGVGSAAAPPDIFGGIAKTPRKRRTRR
jgi:hypothetical protein